MSFAGSVKEELAGQIGVARHCRVAELAALTLFGRGEDGAQSPDGRAAAKAERLLQLLRARSADRILGDLRKIQETQMLRQECCRRAFLRGAFLAAGQISDPERSYHYEILCGSAERADSLQTVAKSLGIDMRRIGRRGQVAVYVKESAQISDLLGLMGANASLLAFESARVVKEVRGSVNRKVNCETANIHKTASAAARQIEDIRFLRAAGAFSALPDGLDEIAELRLQYPEATLAELGAMMDPPIGKSGVNHRLRKLGRIAADWQGKEGEE